MTAKKQDLPNKIQAAAEKFLSPAGSLRRKKAESVKSIDPRKTLNPAKALKP